MRLSLVCYLKYLLYFIALGIICIYVQCESTYSNSHSNPLAHTSQGSIPFGNQRHSSATRLHTYPRISGHHVYSTYIEYFRNIALCPVLCEFGQSVGRSSTHRPPIHPPSTMTIITSDAPKMREHAQRKLWQHSFASASRMRSVLCESENTRTRTHGRRCAIPVRSESV